SIANVAPNQVESAVRKVWSSLWTQRATLSRIRTGIPHEKARMAVLIQEMLDPDYAFVLHTVHPTTCDQRVVYVEIAVGLGEILASAASAGAPYRIICAKESGSTTVLAFANFSEAHYACLSGGVALRTVDYSKIELTRDLTALKRLGPRL